MGWVFIPSNLAEPLVLHSYASTIPVELAKCPPVSTNDELQYERISADVAFVSVKNAGARNDRAAQLLAEELDLPVNDDATAVHGDIAVVASCETLPYGYADLLWDECQSIRDFLMHNASLAMP